MSTNGHSNGTNGGTKAADRPSDARRQELAANIAIPQISNFFSIDRYYEGAQTLFESLQNLVKQDDSLQGHHLDRAYVYSKRYCLFVLDAIPQHNYFTLPKYAAARAKHQKQVLMVIQYLEKVATIMDREEVRLQAERQKLEAERFAQLQARARKQSQFRDHHAPLSDSVEASAMSKLDALMRHDNNKSKGRDPAGDRTPVRRGSSSSRIRLHVDTSDDEDDETREVDGNSSYPTPMPPPPLPLANGDAMPLPPPAYDAVAAHHLHRPQPPPPEQAPAKRQLPMRKRKEMWKREYDQLVVKGVIKTTPLGSYQGRVGNSTNGCTVISALNAATHLATHGGLTDVQINAIMDQRAGPILREIRGKLGLEAHALIIPSDVHDYLVDQKILQQESFLGAAGGNILDESHMGEFIKLLTHDSGDGKKAAATLFYHEHVISVIKNPTSPTTAYYDLIDSLQTCRGKGSRTRCNSVEALKVLLTQYAARKLSDHNCQYIDKTPWSDAMADIDCRVFQGFVWAEK